MLCGAPRGRYSKLVEELQNDFNKGNYDYPVDMKEDYNLLLNYKTSHSKSEVRLVEDSEKVLFANVIGDKGGGGSGACGKRKVRCYCCGKIGHIDRECPDQKEGGADDADREKEKEGEVHVNVEEEDDYDDVGDF